MIIFLSTLQILAHQVHVVSGRIAWANSNKQEFAEHSIHRMQNTYTHEKLSHLESHEIDDLTSRYYAGNKIAELRSTFRIECQANLYTLLPPFISATNNCPNCGGKMVFRRPARNSLWTETTLDAWRCSKCKHVNSKCQCAYCRKNKKLANKSTTSNIESKRDNHKRSNKDIHAKDLSFEQALSLVAFSPSYDKSRGAATLDALNRGDIPFAPQGEYGRHLIKQLLEVKLIQPVSLVDYAVISFTECPTSFMWNLYRSQLNALTDEIYECGNKGTWPEHWVEQLPSVVFSLALAECQEFYDLCMKQKDLPNLCTQNTILMLTNLLLEHSVAQCYGVISAGAQATADYWASASCTPNQAANYMIDTCQRAADQKIQGYSSGIERNAERPRSMISYFLYEGFLKDEDDNAFNLPLQKCVAT